VLSAYTTVLFGGEVTSPFILNVLSGELDPVNFVFPAAILVLSLVDVYLLFRFDVTTNADETPS